MIEEEELKLSELAILMLPVIRISATGAGVGCRLREEREEL
jgi:hypothetical protein